MPSIKLSQQTHDDFQKLKTIISQMLGKDEVDDDQVIASLVGGFLDSLSQETKPHTSMQWCCGGSHKTDHHKKEWSCGWACTHKH